MTQTEKRSPFTMNVDLMHGPILKSLLLFMLPILVSNLFQQLYNTVDTMIVGNVLGDTALAAIGSCGSIYELLVGFGIGIGNGLAIVAARSYGAQDEELLKRTVVGSVVIGLIASLVITAAGFFGLHALLQLLDTPAEILEDAYSYIIVIDLGVVVMFMYNLCAGLLRAIGNSVMPLVFLLISSVLNVGLDLWFIAGVGMGVRGAAVATVIAQGISVVLCVLYVLARVCILIPEKKHFAVGSHLYWELFSQSISMGLMSSIVSAGSVVLQYGINGLGTLTIAGHTAARKLFAFTEMPLISMANAGSTFVSQNRGANQPDRVRRGMRQMYLYSVVVMVAAVVLMNFGAQWMGHGLAGEGRHPHQAERAFDDGAVGLLHAPDPVGVGGASQRYDVLAGEVGDTDLVGGDEPHGRGQLVGRERRQRAAAERHIAGDGRSETCNGPQQGAFARAVAADQRGQRPLGEGGGDIFEQRAAAVGERDMVEGDTHVRRYCGCGRRRR